MPLSLKYKAPGATCTRQTFSKSKRRNWSSKFGAVSWKNAQIRKPLKFRSEDNVETKEEFNNIWRCGVVEQLGWRLIGVCVYWEREIYIYRSFFSLGIGSCINVWVIRRGHYISFLLNFTPFWKSLCFLFCFFYCVSYFFYLFLFYCCIISRIFFSDPFKICKREMKCTEMERRSTQQDAGDACLFSSPLPGHSRSADADVWRPHGEAA